MAIPQNGPARRAAYAALQIARERPLIVYATSTRANALSIIAGDAVRQIVSVTQRIKKENPKATSVDLMLHSYGGDAMAAWRIMCVLRAAFENIAVLIPFEAFSAATMMALGADEIVMHPFASIGPTDPQIRAKSGGEQARFSYEDLVGFLRFLREEVKADDAALITPTLQHLLGETAPLVIGGAKRASDLASDLGERMLRTHIKGNRGKRAKDIATKLNKGSLSHSYAIGRDRAREIGLPIAKSEEKTESLLWAAFEAVEEFMDLRSPFHALSLFVGDKAGEESLSPPAPLRLPPDMPQPMQQQVFEASARDALARSSGKGPRVNFDMVSSLVETASESRATFARGYITASRKGNSVEVGTTVVPSGWEIVPPPCGIFLDAGGSTKNPKDAEGDPGVAPIPSAT